MEKFGKIFHFPAAVVLGMLLMVVPAGADLAAVTCQLQKDPQDLLGIEVEPAEDGVKITSIYPHGLAAESGLEVGEILLIVNGKKVTSSEDVLTASKTSNPWIRVSGVDREGKSFSFVFNPRNDRGMPPVICPH